MFLIREFNCYLASKNFRSQDIDIDMGRDGMVPSKRSC